MERKFLDDKIKMSNYPEKTKRLAGLMMKLYPEAYIKIKGQNKIFAKFKTKRSIGFFFDENILYCTNDYSNIRERSLATVFIITFAAGLVQGFIRLTYLSSTEIFLGAVALASIFSLTIWLYNMANEKDPCFEEQMHDHIIEEFNKPTAEEDINYFYDHYPLHLRTKRWKSTCDKIALISIAGFFAAWIGIYVFIGNEPPISIVSNKDYKYECFEDSITEKYGIVKHTYYDDIASQDKQIAKTDTIIPATAQNYIYVGNDLGATRIGGWTELWHTFKLSRGGKGILMNFTGDTILYFADRQYSDTPSLIFPPNVYKIKVYEEKKDPQNGTYLDLERNALIINDKGERVIPGEFDSDCYPISDTEMVSGHTIISLDGNSRLSIAGWKYYSVIALACFVPAIFFILLPALTRLKRKKGEII